MSPLPARPFAVLVKLLAERERSLAAVIDEHAAAPDADHVPEMTEPAGDLADLAEIELARDRQHATIDRDLQALRDIETARFRLAAGSVNRCVDCGDEVGFKRRLQTPASNACFKRLLAHPTALRCVPCQDLYEQTPALASDAA